MPLPTTRDFVYGKNPLKKVICQVQFPPILKIDTELPAGFQEAIRSDYPILKNVNSFIADGPLPPFPPFPSVTPLGENQIPLPAQLLMKIARNAMGKSYEFSSPDSRWSIVLNSKSLSLTTNKFTSWDEFADKFQKPFDALSTIYSPAHFSRIGLRYIDIIDKTEYGIEQHTPWSALLKPWIIGPLSSPIEPDVDNFTASSEIKLPAGSGNAKIMATLAQRMPGNIRCFMVDTDFYISKNLQQAEVLPKIVFFNSEATKLIRFIVTDEFHEKMDPKYV